MLNPKFLAATMLSAALAVSAIGCASGSQTSSSTSSASTASSLVASDVSASGQKTTTASATAVEGAVLDTSDMFTDRDLTQTVDTSSATYYTVSDGQTITITEEGTYVISGNATNAQIKVEADDSAKVQIVLDGVTVTNDSTPVIYVVSADKVFVTTAEGSANSLSVTGTFTADGDTNTDAVIFSKEDLVLNGTGTLTINSSNNGVTSKDELKVTGGTLNITSANHGLQAHDGVAIADGTITIDAQGDAIHSNDNDDDTVGYFYMSGGTLDLTAASQAIQATTAAEIDGGSVTMDSKEGIEATYIQINGGTVSVDATDDGLNATANSTAYDVVVEITGGDITINMASGDTDGIDANGSIYIKGGNVTVNCQSPFDYDVTGEITGGTVIANGEQVTEMTTQMMGGGAGGMRGGMQGAPTGRMGATTAATATA